jgi:hypothetical protein
MILLSSSKSRAIRARVFTAANKFIDGGNEHLGSPEKPQNAAAF